MGFSFSTSIKKDPHLLFEPTQIQTAIKTLTLLDLQRFIWELKPFRNRVLITKDSDSTLQLLGKATSYEFMSKQKSELLPDNTCMCLRIGLHDYMLNITPVFTPDWFSDAFTKLLGYPFTSLTQSLIYFPMFFFTIQFQRTPKFKSRLYC